MSTGILLVNLGTPDNPLASDVKRYLGEFLSDSRVVSIPKFVWYPLLYGLILPLRAKKTAANYKRIWTNAGSPLLVNSQHIANKLDGNVKLAMRYGNPSIDTAMKAFANDDISALIVLPLYPQYSTSTTASVYDVVMPLAKKYLSHVELTPIQEYSANQAYISAVCHSIKQHWQQHGRAEKLLLSYHGLPQRLVDSGDPYYKQCCNTTKLIAQQLQLKENEYEQVFQSRFGFEKWLQPYCVDTLQRLASSGVKSVDVICPGFPVDCLETLEEIAITNRDLFLAAGGEVYRYIPSLNDSEAHVDALAHIVKSHRDLRFSHKE